MARSRKGTFSLDLANKCDATPDLQPTTNGGPFSIAGLGNVVFSTDGNGHVRHHTGNASRVIAGTTDVFGMTTCGDRLCTHDPNHACIARYDERAQLTESYTFSRPVEILTELAGGLDGTIYTAHAAKESGIPLRADAIRRATRRVSDLHELSACLEVGATRL